MSWIYRLIKRQPNSDTSRSEGEIQFQGISNFGFDSNTTTATIKDITTLDIHDPTTVKLTHGTKLEFPTSTATVLWTTNNVSIITGAATPWNATGVTAGRGSIYLSGTGGSIYVKNTTAATTGWILITAS